MIERHDAPRVASCGGCYAHNFPDAADGPPVPLAEIRITRGARGSVAAAPVLCAACLLELGRIATAEGRRLARVDSRMIEAPSAPPFVTLARGDVGRPHLQAFGRNWLCSSFIGRVMPGDVGKRVYLVGDILQVENDAQRDARCARD